MKRFILGLLIVLFLFAGNFNFTHASVNDFVIRDFQADYYLDKDSEGRSTLKTIELITAEFPIFNQNHGIERALPKSYDGHSTSLDIQLVKNENDLDLPYSTRTSNDNLVLRIGDADTYVHGINVYKITYTQRDVTRFFADTNSDEFYWDTNGTGWSQQFDSVTARLHVGPSIENLLTGKQSCYLGVSGSTSQCRIEKNDNVLTASATGLGAGENITIAVGFQPKTFAVYVETLHDFLVRYSSIISMLISVMILIVIIVLRLTKGKGTPRTTAIVAEYLPPKDIDVALASVIINKEITWVAATYVDLAVRHKIKIYELEKKGWGRTSYDLELISSEGLSDSEMDIVKALFGSNLIIGSKYGIKANDFNATLYSKLRGIYIKAKKFARTKELLFEKKKLIFTMIGLCISSVVMGWGFSTLLIGNSTLLIGFSFFFCIFTAIIGVFVTISINPLTPKGRELHTYLEGLKLYIKIGEQDRLKFLQSPSGAEKTPIDTNDKVLLVKLYEKVLPYAVLFGQEKGWTKSLGAYYEQQNIQPDWYIGNAGFNVVMFSSSLSNFSSSATRSTYAAPSSSSSGGSGGGGSSGGGGGGGGGGGW